jgi:hypothetical protein
VDLELFARVLWRYRLLVAAGLAVAFLLALVSFIRVQPFGDEPRLAYRQSEEWSSAVLLQVTEQGFPEGRTQIQTEVPATPLVGGRQIFAEPGRLVDLTQLYARLVDSAPVRTLVLRGKRIPGRISATAVTSDQGEALPLLQITGVAATGPLAAEKVSQQTDAFRTFIRDNQIQNNVPLEDRVELGVVDGPTKPKLILGRSKTLPVVIFLSTLIAVIVLALAIENVRQRRLAAESPVAVDIDRGAGRASADRRAREAHGERPTVVAGGRRRGRRG